MADGEEVFDGHEMTLHCRAENKGELRAFGTGWLPEGSGEFVSAGRAA